MDGKLPQQKETIFVFGSNLAGRHGAGAARVAYEKFGARYGVGHGLTGLSYAIPTKGVNIQTLPLDQIEKYVRWFGDFTYEHRNHKFFITAVGCGLAGYTSAQIAPMFKVCRWENCSFPDIWKEYLN